MSICKKLFGKKEIENPKYRFNTIEEYFDLPDNVRNNLTQEEDEYLTKLCVKRAHDEMAKQCPEGEDVELFIERETLKYLKDACKVYYESQEYIKNNGIL